MGHQRLVLHVVHVGFERCGHGGGHGGAQFVGRGHLHVVLFRIHAQHHEVAVGGGRELLEVLVEHLYGALLCQHLHNLEFGFDVGDGVAFQEVAHILAHVEGRLLLVAVVVNLLERVDVFVAGTYQFALVEAEASCAQHLLHHGLRGGGVLAGFGQDVHAEGVLRFRHDVVVVVNCSLQEGAVSLLCEFVDAGIEHAAHHAVHVVHLQNDGRVAVFCGQRVRFEEELQQAFCLLLVLVNEVDGLVVVGHGVEFVGGSVLGHLDSREEGLDFALHLVHVDVAHHDDALQVGAIPLFVVVAQFLGLEVVHHAHQADGVAFAVARAGVECGQVAEEHAARGRGAHAPFLVYHAALLVNFLGQQQQAVAPVAQNEQARVDVRFRHGHIVDVVDRFVGRSVGVQVGAKLHADAFAVLHHAVAGEVLCAVEAHVFQKVGQTALVLLLLHRAHLLCYVEEGLVLGQLVVAHIVGKAVGQLTVAHGSVHGQLRQLLSHGGQEQGSHEQQHEILDLFHVV